MRSSFILFAQRFFSQPKILVLNCRENFHVKTFLEQNFTGNIEMKENRGVGELLYSDTFLSGFVAIGPCRLLKKPIY